MNLARTAGLALAAVIFGPVAIGVLAVAWLVWDWAWQRECRAHTKNGFVAAAT